MHITVEDQTVKENLKSFLALLRKAEAKRERRGSALIEKSYHAFLNRSNGLLVFAYDFQDQPELSDKEWKALFVDYVYDPVLEAFRAELLETHKEEGFAFGGLSGSAIQAIKKTIDILNRLSYLVRGENSDLITKIQALCKVQIDVGTIEQDKNLLIAAWHSVDRLGAEKMLHGKAVGTFLFREDYYAKLLGEQLSELIGKKVKCITLTVAQPEEKVSDFTLVHVEHSWRLYSDAHFLNTHGYFEIEDLLRAHFDGMLKEPLYHYFEQRFVA